jgi:hypothetical protein
VHRDGSYCKGATLWGEEAFPRPRRVWRMWHEGELMRGGPLSSEEVLDLLAAQDPNRVPSKLSRFRRTHLSASGRLCGVIFEFCGPAVR